MNHPPIPPNCGIKFSQVFDCIVLYADGEVFAASTSKYRPIITAVARCAWKDEGERLRCITGGTDEEFLTRIKLRNLAYDNEKAWREWGESK